MTATSTPPGQEPAEIVEFIDASADPPTVELPLPDGAVAPVVQPPASVSGVSRRIREVAVGLAIGLVLLAGCIAAVMFGISVVEEARAEDQKLVTPAALTFPGTVTLADPVVGHPGFAIHADTCVGVGEYADVREGTVVTVSAADGTVLVTTRLGRGQPSPASEPLECAFSFTAPDVPPGPSFYLIEVGSHGAVTYTADDLVTYGATLRLGE
jgi:hypothetical protein